MSTKNRTLLAGEEGIEPSLSVLETDVLPLNYSPINKILFEAPKIRGWRTTYAYLK